ncbi:MAG: restriction endonuclease subunit S [Candidatus Bathyarchaeota archaeon]|nr:restriction endonuclease subunit S [Candidatus Bathyarchaeota archaeon]
MNNNPLGPWRQGRLGDEALTEINYGKANPKKEGNIPVIGSSGVYDSTDESLVDAPSILIGRKGNAGSIQLIKEPCWPSDTTFYLKLKSKKLDYNFLSEYLTYRKLSSEKTQTTLPSLSIGDLRYLRIPIPPLVEQRGIVEVLGTVDECIRLTDAVIERAEELKRGLMQRLFTRGIGHTEYKETPLGDRPKNWVILPIGNICKIIDYRGRTPPYSDSGIPHIRSNNIRDGNVIFEDLKYVSEDTYKKYMTRGLPEKGDILFTTEGPLGEVAEINFNIIISLAQRLVCLRSKKGLLLNKFIMYALQDYNVKKECFMRATGTTLKGIASKNFKKVPIFIPPKKEQDKIISILENHDKKLLYEKEKKKHLNLVKQGLMQLLLSGKIRVELKGDGLHRIGDGGKANN